MESGRFVEALMSNIPDCIRFEAWKFTTHGWKFAGQSKRLADAREDVMSGGEVIEIATGLTVWLKRPSEKTLTQAQTNGYSVKCWEGVRTDFYDRVPRISPESRSQKNNKRKVK